MAKWQQFLFIEWIKEGILNPNDQATHNLLLLMERTETGAITHISEITIMTEECKSIPRLLKSRLHWE